MPDSTRYKEWFEMARKDLRGAAILFEHDADYALVCFHCQQAAEKYLKGYLIYKTGILHEGHNLVKLCRRAAGFDPKFNRHLKDSAYLNTFYIEARYPAEDPMDITYENTRECLDIAERIMKDVTGDLE